MCKIVKPFNYWKLIGMTLVMFVAVAGLIHLANSIKAKTQETWQEDITIAEHRPPMGAKSEIGASASKNQNSCVTYKGGREIAEVDKKLLKKTPIDRLLVTGGTYRVTMRNRIDHVIIAVHKRLR